MDDHAHALPVFFYWLDLLALAALAASGALAAARKNMDIGGFVLVGIVAAIGGGTLRDVLLGYPVAWTKQPEYLVICLAVTVAVYVATPHVDRRETWLLWADALGMGLYAAIGADKALAADASPLVAVSTGVIAAAGGGILRDVLCNDIPVILHKEIYATVAAAGAVLYIGLHDVGGLDYETSLIIAVTATFALRAVAIIFSLSLPFYRLRPG
jgi:uncharacterized membrane protein YeiH